MSIDVDSRYSVEVVDASEFVGISKGKWQGMCAQVLERLKVLPRGKSLKITLSDVREAVSYRNAMRMVLQKQGKAKSYVVGMIKTEPVVFVGRR